MTSDALVKAVQAAIGTERRVTAATRSMSSYSSSFRVDLVTVGLHGGAHEELVLKDLSWNSMLAGARVIRDRDRHIPEREIEVYRHFLEGAPPGPPRLLGWVHDPGAGHHWLLLERVEGLQLRHVGDLGAWRDTARWAGRFHARFAAAEESYAIASRLPGWTAERLRRSLQAAAGEVSRHGGREAGRAMAEVARHHDVVVDRLLAAPATLVHGQLYPSNVVVGPGAPPRICVLDWETAAHGPGVIDLAALVEGDWDDATLDDLCGAYLEGRDGAATARALGPLRVDLVCARVQLCLEVLSLPQGFDPPKDHAADWAIRAAALVAELP